MLAPLKEYPEYRYSRIGWICASVPYQTTAMASIGFSPGVLKLQRLVLSVTAF